MSIERDECTGPPDLAEMFAALEAIEVDGLRWHLVYHHPGRTRVYRSESGRSYLVYRLDD